jgi:hypothetical protein
MDVYSLDLWILPLDGFLKFACDFIRLAYFDAWVKMTSKINVQAFANPVNLYSVHTFDLGERFRGMFDVRL